MHLEPKFDSELNCQSKVRKALRKNSNFKNGSSAQKIPVDNPLSGHKDIIFENLVSKYLSFLSHVVLENGVALKK